MRKMLLPFVVLALGVSAAEQGNPTADLGMNETLARKCLDYSLLCLAAYDSDGDAEVLGWEGPTNRYGGYNLNDDFLSLHAAIYRRTTPSGEKEAAMAFRGTDEDFDWVTNLQNFVGLVPEAYSEAATFAQAASILTSKEKIDAFTITGHSLGGGLASYCALLLGRDAICFGSAALGKGAQELLWAEALPTADPFVLHVFKENDIVPIVTATTGKHHGTIAFPQLHAPPNYSKTTPDDEKVAYLAVSGLITRKWLHSGKEAILAKLMEGHGMDQYVAALANLIAPPGRFSPAGEWVSKGSFFDISSNESRFRFCRNGYYKVINDFNFFDLVRQRTNDSGTWSYNAPYLEMTIPGLATMTYQLNRGDGEQVVVWKRESMRSNMPSRESASSPGGRLAAATLEIILRRMEGKTIDWQRTPPTPDQPLYPTR